MWLQVAAAAGAGSGAVVSPVAHEKTLRSVARADEGGVHPHHESRLLPPVAALKGAILSIGGDLPPTTKGIRGPRMYGGP